MNLKNKHRKAQASLEYLFTYGWAILAIVIILGILMANGMFNRKTFEKEVCISQPDFPCLNFYVYEDIATRPITAYAYFNISNSFGHKINITDIALKDKGENAWQRDCILKTLEPGEDILLKFKRTNPNLKINEPLDLDLEIKYINCAKELDNLDCSNSNYNHTIVVHATGFVNSN